MMTLAQLRRLEGGAQPTPVEAQQMVKASKANAPAQIGEFRLVKLAPSIAFYEDNEGTMVVAIAGTRGAQEALTEWWRIPVNQIESGERYKQAEQAVIQARREFPDILEWFGVGHSLGGAIIDSLIEKGLLDAGHSFNPAIQTKHLSNMKNRREFQEGDILGKLARPFASNISYRKKPSGWASRLAQAFHPASRVWDALKAHNLDSFAEGGMGQCQARPSAVAPAPAGEAPPPPPPPPPGGEERAVTEDPVVIMSRAPPEVVESLADYFQAKEIYLETERRMEEAIARGDNRHKAKLIETMATAIEAMDVIRQTIEEAFPEWADIFARATHRAPRGGMGQCQALPSAVAPAPADEAPPPADEGGEELDEGEYIPPPHTPIPPAILAIFRGAPMEVLTHLQADLDNIRDFRRFETDADMGGFIDETKGILLDNRDYIASRYPGWIDRYKASIKAYYKSLKDPSTRFLE